MRSKGLAFGEDGAFVPFDCEDGAFVSSSFGWVSGALGVQFGRFEWLWALFSWGVPKRFLRGGKMALNDLASKLGRINDQETRKGVLDSGEI